MSETRRCPGCGTEIPAESLEGLCPRCVMQAAMAGSDPGQASSATAPFSPSAAFRSPSPEALAAYFPQLEILELLGQGGMGAVYKARQPGLDRLVALKILPVEAAADPAFPQRFKREAQALAKLNHPNIVAVYDFGETAAPTSAGPSRLFYFIMEYVDGVNLRQAMRQGKLQSAEALKIVPQICDALQFAHDEGVVHRDIKPENILIDKRGRVKIADFGLAKLLRVKADHALTGTRQVMGTPHYMAPEQVQGTRDVDHRADIYSLGVTFYEMLTGELPLGRFAPPSQKVQIDVRLDDVVLRSLEVEPAKRYQKASEVKTEVEGISGVAAAALFHAFGKEYRSKAALFGIPLLHIAYGIDPRTGKKRVARGIIALGDVAIGAVACGGLAIGGVAFGGAAVGLIALGGLAVGLPFAFGGVALGGFAFGGAAAGGIAIGGAAVGYYAAGARGWAVHGMFGGQRDPEALEFFRSWAPLWPEWLMWIGIGTPLVSVLLWMFVWLVFRFRGQPAPRPVYLSEAPAAGQGVYAEHIAPGSAPARGLGRKEALEQTIAGLLPEDKVAAIRVYREVTGAGLAEAMAAVRLIAQKHGKDVPVPFSWERFIWTGVWAAAAIAGGFWLAETQSNTANRLMFRLGGFVAALFAIALNVSWHLKRSRWRLDDLQETEKESKPAGR